MQLDCLISFWKWPAELLISSPEMVFSNSLRLFSSFCAEGGGREREERRLYRKSSEEPLMCPDCDYKQFTCCACNFIPMLQESSKGTEATNKATLSVAFVFFVVFLLKYRQFDSGDHLNTN